MIRMHCGKVAWVVLGLGLLAGSDSGPTASAQEAGGGAEGAKGTATVQQGEPKEEEKGAGATKPSIAVFPLASEVTETPTDDPFSFGAPRPESLNDLVARMDKAAKDPAVKAVVVLAEEGEVGPAQIEELRRAMARLREAGKEVYAHSDSLGMRDYVLLCGASRLSVVPTADLWITGLYAEAPYLRGLLDKIGVKPDFLAVGAYKSAAEIFMREGPSPEADAMQNWLIDGLYETFLRLIAEGRKVEPAKARAWVDGGPYTADKAQAAGLIDAVEHRQDLEARLKAEYGDDVVFDKKYGKKKEPQLDFSSPFAMFKIWAELLGKGAKPPAEKKPAVGIVYVDGPIVLGGDRASPFDEGMALSSEVRKALDEAAEDEAIKAVVLRVDSPGGSAVASEIILDATRRVKARKPFVVSMGNVAGSGGYYVSCASDVIFADETTITASIGVVAGKLATTGLWDKLGIKLQGYGRGQNAGMLASSDPFTPAQRERMRAWMEEIYGTFQGHVTAIRGDRLKKPIDELAGGRVFTGRQALELGLVDKIGTLKDAIEFVAAAATLVDYDVRVVPRPKNFLEKLLEEASGGAEKRKGLDAAPAARPPLPGRATSLVDLAEPYLRHLDRRRVDVIRAALQRLQLLHLEGAILMMPELGIAD